MPPALQTIFGPPPRGVPAKRRTFTPADRRGAVLRAALLNRTDIICHVGRHCSRDARFLSLRAFHALNDLGIVCVAGVPARGSGLCLPRLPVPRRVPRAIMPAHAERDGRAGHGDGLPAAELAAPLPRRRPPPGAHRVRRRVVDPTATRSRRDARSRVLDFGGRACPHACPRALPSAFGATRRAVPAILHSAAILASAPFGGSDSDDSPTRRGRRRGALQ